MSWLVRWSLVALVIGALPARSEPVSSPWSRTDAERVGLRRDLLEELAQFASGDGCVVRQGQLAFEWGDPTHREDVASAAKPVYVHFLLRAVQDGLIPGLDAPVSAVEPRLLDLNPDLGYKDRAITWRHLANQTSCYGVTESPGTAYDYSDMNMALLVDTLFLGVYRSSWERVDAEVLQPLLTNPLGCEDAPTFLAFGLEDRPGRLAISCRDFARFGLLYLGRGEYRGRRLLSEDLATMAPRSPLPADVPRTNGEPAQMIAGQRSIGGGANQADHLGSYSFAWWTNGLDRAGRRHWPDVPPDAFGCFGHGGMRALVVIPSLDLVVAWNRTQIESREAETKALQLLARAVQGL